MKLSFEPSSRPVIPQRELNKLYTGGLSGFTSAIVLQPFDLVKTRLQQDNGIVSNKNKPAGLNIASVVRSIYKDAGAIGLWRGTSATLARFVQPSISLSDYYVAGIC